MIHYYQFVPADKEDILEDVKSHIREHLSAVAAEDDDPETNADDVYITVEQSVRESNGEPGFLVRGVLDADPVADYLRDDFDPEEDCARNPLSVPSIDDEEVEVPVLEEVNSDERSES